VEAATSDVDDEGIVFDGMEGSTSSVEAATSDVTRKARR
jgi:hypothetical protein